MASNAEFHIVRGCVKIPVLANKEHAVTALVIGLLQLAGPSFSVSQYTRSISKLKLMGSQVDLEKESVRYVIELTDLEGTLELRLFILDDTSHDLKSIMKHIEYYISVCEGGPNVSKLAERLSLPELWKAAQQARQDRYDQYKANQPPPKTFGVVVPISISKGVSTTTVPKSRILG